MAVFEELSNASEFEEQITNLQGQIDGLDDTYATDTDIQGLQGQIDTLEETVAGLGSGGSSGATLKSEVVSVANLYTRINEIGIKNIIKLKLKRTGTSHLTYSERKLKLTCSNNAVSYTYESLSDQILLIAGGSRVFNNTFINENTNAYTFSDGEFTLGIDSSSSYMNYNSIYPSLSTTSTITYTTSSGSIHLKNLSNIQLTLYYIE